MILPDGSEIVPDGTVICAQSARDIASMMQLWIKVYWGGVMNDGKLLAKSKAFAKEIVLAMRNIRNIEREYVMTDQLLRSGTSIGANIHEANYAQGRADFISKLEIALKECYESDYWLELMVETEYISEEKYKKLSHDCGELRHLLITSCKTAKSKK